MKKFEDYSDILKKNHKFIRKEENDDGWESKFARKVYSDLFKEYVVVDLSKYEEKKVGMRFRTKNDVLSKKGENFGQCGEINCKSKGSELIETVFKYQENGELHHALVKIFLCGKCHEKLKEGTKEEIESRGKRKKKKKRKRETHDSPSRIKKKRKILEG